MKRVFAIIVFAVTVLPYVGTYGHRFAPSDDSLYICKKPIMDGLENPQVFTWSFTSQFAGTWMPLPRLSYAAEVSLSKVLFEGNPEQPSFRDKVAGLMHVDSVVLHGVNAVLLFFFLLSIAETCTKGSGFRVCVVSALATLLWSLHPLRVEPVVWLASRKDLLSFLFGLAFLMTWCRWRRSQGFRWYWLSIVCLCCSVLSKGIAMVFPPIAFVLDWLVFKTVDAPFRLDETLATWRKKVFPHIVPVLLMIVAFVTGYVAQRNAGAMGTQAHLPSWYKAMNACSAFGLYVWHQVWPQHLAVDCVPRWPVLPRLWGLGIPLAVLAGLVVYRGLRARLDEPDRRFDTDFLFAMLLIWCGAILPTTGSIGIHSFCDRFTYIPAIAVSALCVRVGLRTFPKGWRHRLFVACLSLCVLALGWRARWQTRLWADDRALYEHTLRVDGEGNYNAHLQLGAVYWDVAHDLDKSIRHFARAMELNPSYMETYAHLYAMALSERGDEKEVWKLLRWMQDVVSKDVNDSRPQDADAPLERVDIYAVDPRLTIARAAADLCDSQLGVAEAEKELKNASKVWNGNWPYYNYMMGRLAWRKGDFEQAKAYWKKKDEHSLSEPFVSCRFTSGILDGTIKPEL